MSVGPGTVSTRAAARLVLVVLLTTLAVLLALWLLYRLRTIVVWSIVALFLTIALEPAVDWLERHRTPRALGILTAYSVLLVVLAAVVALAVPPMIQQGAQLVHVLQDVGGVGAGVEKVVAPLGLGAAA